MCDCFVIGGFDEIGSAEGVVFVEFSVSAIAMSAEGAEERNSTSTSVSVERMSDVSCNGYGKEDRAPSGRPVENSSELTCLALLRISHL